MPKYLRVRMKDTGHEITIREDQFREDAVERLDKEPLGADGLPLPPKFKTTVKKAAENKATTTGQKADSRKDTD